jgi:predicted Zn-dependent peptidase
MYKTKKLNNNVELITSPIEGTQAACLLVLVKVGSRQEKGKLIGISHFIEHMMFKGTDRRPTTSDLTKELDGVGAEFNAFTGKDYTGYYIKSDTKNLSLSIDVLSDMLLSSKFDAGELEREKGVIVEEINMYEDNPIMHVEELLEEIMYGPHQLGTDIIGTRESVRGMSREDLVTFKERFYGGENIVISLAGKFTQEHLLEIEEKFNFKSDNDKTPLDIISIDQSTPRVSLSFKEMEQTQIALGFPAYSYTDSRLVTLNVLSVILGGNMSSRLFLSVRERSGLAYSIRSGLDVHEDIGALIVKAGLDKSRVDDAIGLIIEELNKMKEGVTDGELSRAKECLFGRTALDLEDSSHVSSWYANQHLMTGTILTPDEKNIKIAAVTAEDIKSVAKEIIDMNKISLAVIGPFKDKEKFANLLQ